MVNPMDLSERRILVTGASSGIGRQTSILLSQLGAEVTVSGRKQEELDRTMGLLEGSGHNAVAFDLNEPNRIPAWIKEQASVGGPYHGVVHVAGVLQTIPLRVLEASSLEETMRVNFQSGVMIARGFRQKGCRAQGQCSIVFLGSITGLVGDVGISAYSASKAAIMGVTRSLAIELAPESIRVNAVAPGIVQSEMWDKQKAALTVEQVAGIERRYPLGIVLLADTGRWITGSTLILDGGYTAI
jgi:NAD(P)-dependent dehydrogenase (short-subunit alcohol dehydrogenase family)